MGAAFDTEFFADFCGAHNNADVSVGIIAGAALFSESIYKTVA
jgi:hypothetical protein